MKTLLFSKLTLLFGLVLACALSLHFAPSPQHHSRVNAISAIPHPIAAPQPDQPAVNDPSQPQVIEIRQDQHSDVTTVTVQVPPGIKHVTLQSLDGANDWVSRAIAYVDGSGKNLRFRVPAGVKPGNLRVLGAANSPLPPASDARAPLRSAANAQTKFALLSATRPPAPQTNPGATDTTAVGNDDSTTNTPRSGITARTSGKSAVTRFTFLINSAACKSST